MTPPPRRASSRRTAERVIRWDDPDIAIQWPFEGEPLLSKRDAAAPRLKDAEVFP